MNETKLPPVGACIYCDANQKSTQLTDEHIIPFGFDGQYVLQKASCKSCAAITSGIERFCLREMYLEVRVHLNMRTRRPKNRPTTLPVFYDRPDGEERRDLPISEHPLVLRLPRLSRAPILTGKQGSKWVEHLADPFWTFIGYPEGTEEDIRKRIAALGDFKTNFSYAPTQFCLMMANIAHAATVAKLGYRSFKPLLNRLIIKKSNEVHDYVGVRPLDPPKMDRNTKFYVGVTMGVEYIVAYLCPFAHLGAPVYEVIVGRPL
jgi:hypothetical protein